MFVLCTQCVHSSRSSISIFTWFLRSLVLSCRAVRLFSPSNCVMFVPLFFYSISLYTLLSHNLYYIFVLNIIMISICFPSPSSILFSCWISIRTKRQTNVTLLRLFVLYFCWGFVFMPCCCCWLAFLSFLLILPGFRSSCNFISSVLHQFCSFFHTFVHWFVRSLAQVSHQENC